MACIIRDVTEGDSSAYRLSGNNVTFKEMEGTSGRDTRAPRG
jgi:hypothetical protein